MTMLCAALTLTACGGGGGGGGGSTPPASTLPPSDTVLLDPVSGAQLPAGSGIGSGTAPLTLAQVSDAEYNQNSGFDDVRVYAALQWNIKGDGVKIAVLDSGVDSDHVDLASNLSIAGSGNAIGTATYGTGYEDAGNHGTRVAGIALANDNGAGMQGVAPNAQLMAIKVTDGGSLTEANQIRGMDMARNGGADIVNISFGLSGYENQDLQGAVNSGAMTQALIDAYKRGVNDDIIYTLAAGNSGASQPEWDGKMAAYGASGGQMLVVGSLSADGNDIASFSNRAGDAKNYFILAPGHSLTLTDSDGGYAVASGTSFAAPFVAGAAALVKSSGPPTLTGKDVVEILLSTTDEMGDPGNDAIYGAGRLNIERALSPVGSPVVSTASSLGGGSVPLGSLGVSNSGLIGSNVSQASALKNVLFFDSYNRAYTTDLSSSATRRAVEQSESASWLTTKTYRNQMAIGDQAKLTVAYTQDAAHSAANLDQAQVSLTTRLGDTAQLSMNLGNNWASTYGQDGIKQLSSKSFLSLTNQGAGGQLSSSLGDKTKLRLRAGVGENSNTTFDGRQALAMVGLDQKLADKTLLSFDVGVSRETNQIMGTELGAGFKSVGDIDTQFASVGLQHQLKPNLNIGMNYSFGRSADAVGNGLMKTFAGGDLDSAEIWLGYEGEKQSFQAGVSRELAYRSGSMMLAIPQSVTYEGDVGTVHFNEQNIDLKTDTAYSASLSYSRELGKFGSLELMGKLKATHTETGSIGFADTSVDAGLKYKLAF